MNDKVTCEYCDREVISRQLKRHQTSRVCLLAQGKSIEETQSQCLGCSKLLTIAGHQTHKCKKLVEYANLQKKLKAANKKIRVLKKKPKILNIATSSNVTTCNKINDKLQDIPKRNTVKHDLILDNITINMRDDGYINVTSLCKAGNKDIQEWLSNTESTSILSTFSEMNEIPINDIIQSDSNTYAHPDIAILISQWISADVYLKILRWIRELSKVSLNTSNTSSKGTEKPSIIFDIRPYDKLDVLYIGQFEAPSELNLKHNIPDSVLLYKFGVTSDITGRLRSHESGKQFPNFRILHIIKAETRNKVSELEKYAKRTLYHMKLKLNYGTKQECFMANDEQLQQIIESLTNFVNTDMTKYVDLELSRSYERKRLLDLLTNEKITYEQMEEMLNRQ